MQERREIRVWSLGRVDLLDEGMATTIVFLPGESHGTRSLVGYSPSGHKEWHMTEVTWRACYIDNLQEILNTRRSSQTAENVLQGPPTLIRVELPEHMSYQPAWPLPLLQWTILPSLCTQIPPVLWPLTTLFIMGAMPFTSLSSQKLSGHPWRPSSQATASGKPLLPSASWYRSHLLPHLDLEGCCTSPVRAGRLWPWSFPLPPYMYTGLCDFEEREHTHLSIPQCLLLRLAKSVLFINVCWTDDWMNKTAKKPDVEKM